MLWSVIAWPGRGGAQAPERAVPVQSVEAASAPSDLDDQLVRAVDAYEAADYDTAGALFEAVHHRAPTARTLRGLALVAYKQRRFEAAAELFEASLAHPVKPLEGRLRDDALSLLERTRAELGAQPVAAPPPAEASGLIRSEAKELTTDAKSPVVVQPREESPQTPGPAGRSRRLVRLKRTGYSLLALGATTLVLAGTAWAVGSQRLANIAEACSNSANGACTPAEAAERQRAARLTLISRLTTAGLVIGLASAGAAVTTLTLYYTGPGQRGTADTAWGVSLRGRF